MLGEAGAIAISIYAMARLPSMRPGGGATPVSWRATWDGWRFIFQPPVLRGALATDLAATVLAMPIALFPTVNQQRFGGNPRTLGLFLPAIAVGGVVASLTSVQRATPDSYLDRVGSVEKVVGTGGPGLGNARAGAVASLTSASLSTVAGGLACVLAVTVVAATHPALRRWRSSEPVGDRSRTP